MSPVRRLPVEIQAEVQRLTAKIRDSEDDAVLRSLVSAREALEWAEGRASCTPTDFIIEPGAEQYSEDLQVLRRLTSFTPQQLDGMACARCRPKPMTRLDSGPQSENQWETQMRETYPGWGEGE